MSPGETAVDVATARRLVSMMDLTSLNEGDDSAAVERLAKLAVSPAGRVAALCIWPRFIGVARAALCGCTVPVAAVTNFPDGTAGPEAAAAETAAAVGAGADEVDLVFPYPALLAGDSEAGAVLMRLCRAACGTRLLKVILETGQLATPELIRRAADLAIDGGADFLKTSTGKTQPGVTPAAVSVLLDAIEAARGRGRSVGLKVSGGIRSGSSARSWLERYESRFGAGSATPATFRIGASSLLTELRAVLESGSLSG